MKSLINELINILKGNKKYTVEGKLLKNKIVEDALKLEPNLLKLLLKSRNLKKHFFQIVDDLLVFDKIKFQRFVSNKQFLPDSYTSFKNKIGLIANGEYLTDSKEVVLAWPYKDCILEGGQNKEDSKRNEIFWNETLAPDEIDRLLSAKAFTNWKKYDVDGEHKLTKNIDFDKENLIIKGNNLLALHSLVKRFRGKVKLIYIDPPYNTGNDSFGYNDKFNHSTWLTFMKNRLEIAKELLRKDGFIIVHCDQIEDSYTKMILDEVFGRMKYVNNIAIRDSHPSGLKLSAKNKTVIKTKSTMLIYRLTSSSSIKPVYQRRDKWDTHFNTFVNTDDPNLIKESLKDVLMENNILKKNENIDHNLLKNISFRKFAFNNRNKIFQSTKEIPSDAKKMSLNNRNKVIKYKDFEYAYNERRLSPLSKSIQNIGFDFYYEEDFGKLLCDFWDDVDFNNSQNEGDVSFPSGKKPEFLLARLISMFSNEDDLILDFFSGSGTTMAVAHKMKRRYIGIEQMDYINTITVPRLQKVIGEKYTKNGEWVERIKCDEGGISKAVNWEGGGSFVYCELMKLNQNWIDKIQEAKTDKELEILWQAMQEEAFISYKVDFKEFDKNAKEFKELSFENKQKLLIETLDKNQLYVNYSEIEDEDYKVSDDDKLLNTKFYGGK